MYMSRRYVLTSSRTAGMAIVLQDFHVCLSVGFGVVKHLFEPLIQVWGRKSLSIGY